MITAKSDRQTDPFWSKNVSSCYFTPPLTTIKQDFKEIGKQAVIQAMKLVELGTQSNIELHQHHIPVDLIKRRSSGQKETSNYNKHEIQQLLRHIEEMLPGEI